MVTETGSMQMLGIFTSTDRSPASLKFQKQRTGPFLKFEDPLPQGIRKDFFPTGANLKCGPKGILYSSELTEGLGF